jgi:hypothetical protein
MLETAIQHLHKEAEHSLTRIKRLFPKNEPPEGLGIAEFLCLFSQ